MPGIPRLRNPRYAINSTSSQPSLIIRLPFRVGHQLCSHTLFTLHLSIFAAELFSFLTVTPSRSICLQSHQRPQLHLYSSLNQSLTVIIIIAMKHAFVTAAVLAVGATAQNSTSTSTLYYNTCTSTAPGTVTELSTLTYCPPCEAASMTTFAGGSLTTYTTVFKQVCPTDAARLEDTTYTVTEPCPSTGIARDASYIPQGFTVSTVSCSACAAGKSQYAQTTPVPALASALAAPAAAPAVPTPAAEGGNAAPPAPAGAPASPPPPPAGAASPANAENAAAAPAAPGAVPPAENGAPAPAAAGAASPAENGAAAPGGSPAGASAPYPLPAQAGQVAAASGAPASNGNSTVPFTGAANVVGISFFVTALATLITGFAFVL